MSAQVEGDKRERASAEDTVLAANPTRQLLVALQNLQDELSGLEWADECFKAARKAANELQANLESGRRTLCFSSLDSVDLQNIGIIEGEPLFSEQDTFEDLFEWKDEHDPVMTDLNQRIDHICSHVNLTHDAGVRILVDAIILAIASLLPKRITGRAVAICPGLLISTPEHPVEVQHPETKETTRLTGTIGSSIVQYKEDDMEVKDALFGAGSTVLKAFELGRVIAGLILFDTSEGYLVDSLPQAVGQAVALMHKTKQHEVCLCVTNGREWMPAFITRGLESRLIYRQLVVPPFEIDFTRTSGREEQVRKVVEVLIAWFTEFDSSLVQP